MKNDYCKGCGNKRYCRKICTNLEGHLKVSGDRASTLSGDYIDKVFSSRAGEWLQEKQYENLDKRGKAVRGSILHFQKFGCQSVRFFWMWNASRVEGLSNGEIAYILGISRQMVSRIFSRIKKSGYGGG